LKKEDRLLSFSFFALAPLINPRLASSVYTSPKEKVNPPTPSKIATANRIGTHTGGRSATSTSSRVSKALAADGTRRAVAVAGRAGSDFWISEVIDFKELGVNALILDMSRKKIILVNMVCFVFEKGLGTFFRK
jgi:hypothetical protein